MRATAEVVPGAPPSVEICRRLRGVSTLADYPHLVAQLDRSKNGHIDPDSFSAGSNRRLWWRCSAGLDHVWSAMVVVRTKGHGCPFCAGKRLSVTNRLSDVAPEIARTWHPTKNGALTPSDVTAGAGRYVWWRCDAARDHVWRATVGNRVKHGGCPFCSGPRLSGATNSLAARAPELARQWHPTKNGELRPRNIYVGSSRVVWWKCPAGVDHEWKTKVHKRTRDTAGCPFCTGNRVSASTSLAALAPDVAAEWHPTKNGRLTPRDVTAGSSRRVWWKCREGHEWSSLVTKRGTRGHNCPFCFGSRLTLSKSLGVRAPALARQWHPTKNGRLTPWDVAAGSSRRVWWKCPNGEDHAWETAVHARTVPPRGCPFCANRRVSKTNSLATRFPKIAREWHPTKNGALTPADVVATTHKYAWWRCAFGHDWRTAIDLRTDRLTGCPHCFRRKQPVAATGKRGRRVQLNRYDGATHGPVRRAGPAA
jgi:hypothetical protein